MLLRWMVTLQVRFLFLGCERLDEESTLTGEWNTPSQLTGDCQVCATVSPPNRCRSASQPEPGSRCLLEMPRPPPHSMPRHCNRRFVFWCRRHAPPSRRGPWQAPREKTRTSRYSTTSLRRLHDHHDANLIGLPRDLWRLLTVMEAGGVASSLGVQKAPRRRRACVVRGVSVSGRKLSQNAFGVQLGLAATASHPRTPPPTGQVSLHAWHAMYRLLSRVKSGGDAVYLLAVARRIACCQRLRGNASKRATHVQGV